MVTFRTPTTDTVKEKVRETRYISNKTEMSEGIQMLMNIDMIRDMANVKIREYGIGYDNAFKTARNEYFGLEPAV